MSLPPSLLFSARSTYRSVLRSARITFAGDIPRRAALESAVRNTFRSPTLTPPSSSSSSSSGSATQTSEVRTFSISPEMVSQRLSEWNEIANFLRKNVVQGTMDESGSYKLRVTKDTELNDNTRDLPSDPKPLTPFPNRNKDKDKPKVKCGETPPEAPAFW